MVEIKGIGISGKKASGSAYIFEKNAKHYPKVKDIVPEIEKKRFEEVVFEAEKEIDDIISKAKKENTEWEIFESHKLILEDLEVNKYILNLLGQGYDLLSALVRTKADMKAHFLNMKTEIMRSKAADIEDIFERMIKIQSGDLKAKKYPSNPFILICDEILPSMLYQIPQKSLKGIICRFGSNCSHGAILARNRCVPVVINLKNRIDLIKPEARLVMSGETGTVFLLND